MTVEPGRPPGRARHRRWAALRFDAGRGTLVPAALAAWLAAGCGPRSRPVEPVPVAPLPAAGLAGQTVVVYPLTWLAADWHLPWAQQLGPRRAALQHADSLLAQWLVERAPQVTWVFPPQLRQAARRNAPVAADPDRLATATLRDPGLKQLPDPLWSELRTLTALAGERYVLVPASLVFRPARIGGGVAELTVVLADVRTGAIGWRSVASGQGFGPWEALAQALERLLPEPR